MINEKKAPSKKSPRQVPNIIFFSFLIIVLLVSVSIITFTNWRPGDYRRFDQLNTTNEEEWLKLEMSKNGNQKKYLVFVYNRESTTQENELIMNKLVDYANYARTNNEAPKLYILDFDGDFSGKIKEHLPNYSSISDLPYLVVVENQKVSTHEKKVSSILTYLENLMS